MSVLSLQHRYNSFLNPHLSVVIPAYNEERRLPSTLDAILAFFADGGYGEVEVIVVDDGSRD